MVGDRAGLRLCIDLNTLRPVLSVKCMVSDPDNVLIAWAMADRSETVNPELAVQVPSSPSFNSDEARSAKRPRALSYVAAELCPGSYRVVAHIVFCLWAGRILRTSVAL